MINIPPPVLEIRDLTVRYATAGALASAKNGRSRFYVALSKVSLSVKSGETLGLIGETGSGKSTLGRAVIGLERAASGSVKFLGQELVGATERQFKAVRRHASLIFQDPVASLSPRKTVYESVMEPYRIHERVPTDARERAIELLASVGLDEELLSAYPYQLSGGQARRVGIARAIALSPKLMIADEPTAGLDVSIQGETLNLLADIRQRHNMACLFITHNIAVARHVCDRIAVLYRGAICEIANTDQIVEQPKHPYSRILLRAAGISTEFGADSTGPLTE